MNARSAIALLTVASIVGAACGSSDTSSTTVPSTTPATAATSTSTTRPGAELGSEIEEAIEAWRIQGDIPSLGAGIVIDDELVWVRGFGDQPSTDTVYMVASIDKVIFGTAVMQLVEQGLIDLDADVGDYLPFPVRNPEYPENV